MGRLLHRGSTITAKVRETARQTARSNFCLLKHFSRRLRKSRLDCAQYLSLIPEPKSQFPLDRCSDRVNFLDLVHAFAQEVPELYRLS